MKKEVIIVPEDKCPLEILAELGERTKNAWIYLHANAANKLLMSCNEYEELANSIRLRLIATEKYSSTTITIGTGKFGVWEPVYFIESDDIEFKYKSSDPKEIFFLAMEK